MIAKRFYFKDMSELSDAEQNAERQKNLQDLREGLNQPDPCTYVGPMDKQSLELSGESIPADIREFIESMVPNDLEISSVELYASGSINAYLRDPDKTRLMGFIRYRP